MFTEIQWSERGVNLLLRLADLPLRQTGIAIRRRVDEVAPVDGHLNDAVHRAKIHQLAADPVGLLHRRTFLAHTEKDGAHQGSGETSVGFPPRASVMIWPSQEISMPCCHSKAPFRSINR